MHIVSIIIAQFVFFALIIFILRKMMLGDTESAVNRLNEAYLDMNKKKEALTERIKEIETEYEKRKAEAETIASEIKDKAEKEGYAKRDEIIKRAKVEGEQIIADAVSAKDKIRQDIFKEEKLKIVDYCEDFFGNLFAEDKGKRINHALAEDFIEELKSVDMSHVPASVCEVEIVCAVELDDSINRTVQEIIGEKLNRGVSVKTAVEKEVLGGMIIRFGSLVLDGSLSGRIRETALDKKRIIEGE